jgi:hypothetical protein
MTDLEHFWFYQKMSMRCVSEMGSVRFATFQTDVGFSSVRFGVLAFYKC